MSVRSVDVETASELLDFSGGDKSLQSLGQLQLEGTVALNNMIADPSIGMGYLADEVGMGKTYIALGVVALMRYFNPSLRVLYICPSNNVQEKWYEREHRSFIERNVKVGQFRVRTPEGQSAVPKVNCRNATDLIMAATSGYYADFFVGMGAFSISLTEDQTAWQGKLDDLRSLIPAVKLKRVLNEKRDVKDQYAMALNYVLPRFDLVIIDEAHNFKHGFSSSDRNFVLSKVLGFRGGLQQKVDSALLLSATPYDREINQLRNQLKLVGKGDLLPDEIVSTDTELVRCHLARFMVRRLNVLTISGKAHTRNMYRREYRDEVPARIELVSDEQKLVTALVQKRVGEMLSKKEGGPSFQMGLLASFESYSDSSSNSAEFETDVDQQFQGDAEDKNVILRLRKTYTEAGLGKTLPHPKMDAVTRQLATEIFDKNRKQIVFVCRVKSVKEIKAKLDEAYDKWLHTYLGDQLPVDTAAGRFMEELYQLYLAETRFTDPPVDGGEFHDGRGGDIEDVQPPANDTFFSWFFRGAGNDIQSNVLQKHKFTSPDLMRRGLIARDQAVSRLLEINWARTVCRHHGEDLDALLSQHGEEFSARGRKYFTARYHGDELEIFQASQFGFIEWYADNRNWSDIKIIFPGALEPTDTVDTSALTPARCVDALATFTVYDAIDDAGLTECIAPLVPLFLNHADQPDAAALLQKLIVHQYLVALCLRTGHGVVDLYASRIRQGTADLNSTTRRSWLTEFANALKNQKTLSGFSTFWELEGLAQNLDLILKSCLPEALDKNADELRRYLSKELNPVSPFIGASGQTVGTRSAQARKFRMPGYPLGLITTDVFQEGEDLHTFCDSVVHYGLGSSPVSIEQKNGRVDRIGSLAQRRLLSKGQNETLHDGELIQVSFPHVKESIEVLQVRTLCQNMNKFLEGLHDVGSADVEVTSSVDTDTELLVRHPIPLQIKTPLTSPYVPKVPEKRRGFSAVKEIQRNAKAVTTRLEHIKALVESYFNDAEHVSSGARVTNEGVPLDRIVVTSARASGEMLIKAVSTESEQLHISGMHTSNLINHLVEKSWHHFARTTAHQVASNQYIVKRDSELLVGAELNTYPEEIAMFFQRFDSLHNPENYHRPLSEEVFNCWQVLCEEGVAEYGQVKATVTGRRRRDHLELTVLLGLAGNQRKHVVRVYEYEGRCIFLAVAADSETVGGFSKDQLINLTWVRNALVDVVEFCIDDDHELVSRAVQPICGLTERKFAYCVYTLAMTTDRLEYVLQQPDLY